MTKQNSHLIFPLSSTVCLTPFCSLFWFNFFFLRHFCQLHYIIQYYIILKMNKCSFNFMFPFISLDNQMKLRHVCFPIIKCRKFEYFNLEHGEGKLMNVRLKNKACYSLFCSIWYLGEWIEMVPVVPRNHVFTIITSYHAFPDIMLTCLGPPWRISSSLITIGW